MHPGAAVFFQPGLVLAPGCASLRPMNHRTTLLAAGLFGATGVAIGAFGAHGLHAFLLERGMSNAWETGVRYHLLHAVALLAVALWLRHTGPGSVHTCARWTARCWTVGVLLFSGSLYGIALGGPRWLGPVTPVGGLALLAGWFCLIAAALVKEETES
jgi:uncharacterized membrane protein YgdD (TMEM256/DUF423 family)